MKTFSLEASGALARYDYLWCVSDDRWAWEYARRSEAVREAAKQRRDQDVSYVRLPCHNITMGKSRVRQNLAERLGFVIMPDPDQNCIDADVVWTKQAFPNQVKINCSPLRPGDNSDVWDKGVAKCDITHITDTVGREFLLIRRYGRVIQIRCTGLSLMGMESVNMNLAISDLEDFESKVRIQRAALAIFEEKEEAEHVVWTKRTQILRDGLIALDCMELGMSRREIASVLYGAERVDAEWDGPSLTHSMRYLVKKALGLRDGGFLVDLLRSQIVGDFQLASASFTSLT